MQPTLRRPRIDDLDALRGFALCGILLVNVPQLTRMPGAVEPGRLHPVREALDLTVQYRFFPIFSFLFGLSFALFFDSAAARTGFPFPVVARRLLALGLLGAAHQLLHPGEALLPYAIAGLLVLLPTARLPRPAPLYAGAALTLAGCTLAGGGLALIPGLFLLGSATARYGIAETIAARTRQLTVVFALAAPAAVAATVWQHRTWLDAVASRSATVAGLLTALAYTSGFLLWLRTPLRPALTGFFAPLGRMALTNYVSATVLVLAASPLLGLHGSDRWYRALGLAVAVLAVQAAASRAWLAGHRYGPLEWFWRCVTWWEPVPLALRPGARPSAGRPAGEPAGRQR
ncbi:DUF418 domain-containing protein [Kitasatospora sp. NPDC049285]|uniref:DUF418 domain-containing protein n=1 Tax=Kitasatospora sp. NPDC049285 TaxID=3157096 RepID=UPI003412914D